MNEDFKRPNHADFMLSSELKKMEYSGVRHNALGDCMEIWILGEVADSMSITQIKQDPKAFNRMYADRFGLNEVTQDGTP